MSDNDQLSAKVAMEIKVAMTRRHVSGRQLAATLGVSQTWVSTRLSGTTPIDLNDLDRIAEALDMDVADLLPASRERAGRVLTTVGRPAEDQRPRIKLSRSPLAKQPRPNGHPTRKATDPSLTRTGRKR